MNNTNNNDQSWTVNANLPVSFTITCSEDILNPSNQDLLRYNNNSRRLAVVDKKVYEIYGQEIESYFSTNNTALEICVIDATEENKTFENSNIVLKFFEDHGVLRREVILAIGGGVLLDIVGFCCAVYRRGIPYIKIPTTLLGIVDASIGTKVAVNHFDRRNRIGTYYPPIASFLDKNFIRTQDHRHITNGLAEIFKIAVIKNHQLFILLEEHYDLLIDEKFQNSEISNKVISLSISTMLNELSENLWEKILERPVDFGHSFSPLIEMKNVQSLFHGEAVALDCLFSACLSLIRDHISETELDRIFRTARNLNLPTWHIDFTNINMLKLALNDTIKHRNGNQYLPVPLGIGNCAILNNVSDNEIARTIEVFQEYENSRNNRNN